MATLLVRRYGSRKRFFHYQVQSLRENSHEKNGSLRPLPQLGRPIDHCQVSDTVYLCLCFLTSQKLICGNRFGGLLTTEFLEPPPGRCFLFRQTYRHTIEGPIPANLRELINSAERPRGPLLHFHQFQTEYFKVETGIMGIEINGEVKKVLPDDGEISVKAGSIHRFFIHPDSPESMTVYLSASDSGMDFQLDRIFFENWYGYWHDALLHDGGLDWIQFLAVRGTIQQ